MLRYRSITLAEKHADRHGRDTLIPLIDPYDARLMRVKALQSMGFPISIEIVPREAGKIPIASRLGRVTFHEEDFRDCLFELDMRQWCARPGGWERRMYWHPASLLEPIYEGRPEAVIGYARNLKDAHMSVDQPVVASAFMAAMQHLKDEALPNIGIQYHNMIARGVRPIAPDALLTMAVDYYQGVACEWPSFAEYGQQEEAAANQTEL